jgi:hypothetical protein
MKIQRLINEKIYHRIKESGKHKGVILINPLTFKELVQEINQHYPFQTEIKIGTFKYQGFKVCRTIDIDPDFIEVY